MDLGCYTHQCWKPQPNPQPREKNKSKPKPEDKPQSNGPAKEAYDAKGDLPDKYTPRRSDGIKWGNLPPKQRALTLEVGGRMNARGEILA